MEGATIFREIFTVFGEGMFSKLITNGFKQGEHDVNILRNSVYSWNERLLGHLSSLQNYDVVLKVCSV